MTHPNVEFEREVLNRSHDLPVLVDFWAPWCGPCKMLGPVLDRVSAESGGRWHLVKVNIDEHPALATTYRVTSIPAVKLFIRGEVVAEFLGYRSEADVRRWMEPHLPSSTLRHLDRAAELIDDGDLVAARALLQNILQATPDHAAANVLMAETLLGEDPARAQELLHSIPVTADEYPSAQALGLLARALGQDRRQGPEADREPRLLRGLDAVRRRDWSAALECFVTLVEDRKSPSAAAAADAGKAVFRYLGVRHPIADKFYRRFSSALNA